MHSSIFDQNNIAPHLSTAAEQQRMDISDWLRHLSLIGLQHSMIVKLNCTGSDAMDLQTVRNCHKASARCWSHHMGTHACGHEHTMSSVLARSTCIDQWNWGLLLP